MCRPVIPSGMILVRLHPLKSSVTLLSRAETVTQPQEAALGFSADDSKQQH